MEIQDHVAQWAVERQTRIAQQRHDVIGKLRLAGVEAVDATYDAYGDSGNVDDVTLTPEVTLDDAVMMDLRDLLWAVVYDLHPGFENNDGGMGEISWDVVADKISVEHAERFTDLNHYSHEDV